MTPVVELRRLTPADEAELRALLCADPWNHVYLLGVLHCFGVRGGRARFTGAFAGGRLAGVLGEAREVHCWYASLSAGDPAAAAALGRELVAPHVEVLLGREDVVEAALSVLPTGRVRRRSHMVLGISHDAMPSAPSTHPVRRATRADLPGLVDLYEGYEFDGYPTRRHVRRALEERIARGGVWVLEVDGRPVAARRIDASSPEVVLLGGLTVDPRYRGRDLAEDVRRACIADLGRQGVAHCSLAHVDNERVATRREHRDFAPWLVANLGMPPAPPWKDFLRRVRARLSPEDRPVRRRRAEFTPR